LANENGLESISPGNLKSPAYENGIFMPVAPEQSWSEDLLGALNREMVLGLKEHDAQNMIIKIKEDLEGKEKSVARWILNELDDDQEFWKIILDNLESPSPRGGNPKQLIPFVPGVSAYCNIRRASKSGSPWRPAKFFFSLLRSGVTEFQEYENYWNQFKDALAVDEETDDHLATKLDKMLRQQYPGSISPPQAAIPPSASSHLPEEEIDYKTPSQEFVRGLNTLINLKPSLTRKQWISLVEGWLRLGFSVHFLWLVGLPGSF
jgi:hypothetical protein